MCAKYVALTVPSKMYHAPKMIRIQSIVVRGQLIALREFPSLFMEWGGDADLFDQSMRMWKAEIRREILFEGKSWRSMTKSTSKYCSKNSLAR
jgi:hypothetical protein